MNKFVYDAGMHPRPTRSQTSQQARACRPKADSPTIAANDLADLRRGWGDAYRITRDSNRFRATHIISGQTMDADDADELRKLIRTAERDRVGPTLPDRRTDS